MRYPGKMVIEFLKPIEPGLNKEEFSKQIYDKIEYQSDKLVEEAKRKFSEMSKSALKWIIIFLVSILLLYSTYWLIVSSQFKSQVSSMLNETNNISYQSILFQDFLIE